MKPILSWLAITVLSATSQAQALFESSEHFSLDSQANDGFGSVVTCHGNLMLVGAPQANVTGSPRGAAYLIDVESGDQIHKLTLPPGAPGNSGFGAELYLGEEGLFVAAPWDNTIQSDGGVVCRFDPESGQLLYAYSGPNPAIGATLGFSIDVDGARGVAGAHGYPVGTGAEGAAFVFDVDTGQTLHTLLAPASPPSVRFGEAVAIEGDRIFVGSGEDGTLGQGTGAVYVFDAVTGQQVDVIHSSTPEVGARFGRELIVDGDRLLVGAPHDNGAFPQSGAAYVFDTTTLAELFKWTAPGNQPVFLFGESLALDDGLALVGQYEASFDGTNSGVAHLFNAVTGEWVSQLVPTVREPWQSFGRSMGLHDGLAVVGAQDDDTFGQNAGSAYVFDDVRVTEPIHHIQPPAGQTQFFGFSAATDGDLGLVGSRYGDDGMGRAQLFDLNSGLELHVFRPHDPGGFDFFGDAVSLSESWALIGSPNDDDNGEDSGSAYVFDLATRLEQSKLLPLDGAAGEDFGEAVSVSGGLALVGAPEAVTAGGTTGAAYLFDAATGSQLIKLTASDAADGDRFGDAVAVDGDRILVGAWRAGSVPVQHGAVYVFDATTGQELMKLTASDADDGDYFGGAVALHGNLALIGAHGVGALRGAGYLVDISTGTELMKLGPDWAPDGAALGVAVDFDGDYAVLGATGDSEVGSNGGAAYLFRLSTGELFAKLARPGGGSGDNFGSGVGISGNRLLLSGYGANSHAGAAAVYPLPGLEDSGWAFCFGDGTGADCPCGNAGLLRQGCQNSSGKGATLVGVGSSSITSADFLLAAQDLPPGSPALYFQGQATVSGGSGLSFGDGLRCAGGAVTRLQVVISGPGGESQSSVDLASAGGASAGDTRYYQLWYRDPGSVCGGLFNLTNGWAVEWEL